MGYEDYSYENYDGINELLNQQELIFKEASIINDCKNHILIPSLNNSQEKVLRFIINRKLNVLIIVDNDLHREHANKIYDYMKRTTNYNLIGIAFDINEAQEFLNTNNIDYIINVGHLGNPGNLFIDAREKQRNIKIVQYSWLDDLIKNFCHENKIIFQFDIRLSLNLFIQYLMSIQNYCDAQITSINNLKHILTCCLIKDINLGLDKNDDYALLIEDQLNSLIYNSVKLGYSRFMSEVTDKWALWFIKTILNIKQDYGSDFELIATMPYEYQFDKTSYNNKLNPYDKLSYIKDKEQDSSRHMIDHSDLIIILHDENSKFTMDAISYAAQLNKACIIIKNNF